MTAYALGIAVGGPLLTAATMRYGRRPVLLSSLTTYVAGNVLLVLAANFGLMLAARLITSALQGLFIGVAFAIGTSVVPPARMGYAISIVLGGVSVSTALGVPIGTFIGQQFGWRTTFAAIVVLSAIALVAALRWIPAVADTGTSSRAQAKHALAPKVLAVLGAGFLVLGGQFAALTYLGVYLQNVTGVSAGTVGAFLLVYGIANAVGTFAGGRAADRNAVHTLAATLPASALTAGIAAGSAIGGWALAHHGSKGAVATALILCAAACPAIWLTGRLRPRVAHHSHHVQEESWN